MSILPISTCSSMTICIGISISNTGSLNFSQYRSSAIEAFKLIALSTKPDLVVTLLRKYIDD
jgi:hypothetical protein